MEGFKGLKIKMKKILFISQLSFNQIPLFLVMSVNQNQLSIFF